ncbi:condensation domain-containing protein [Pedobacter gandavensis]|uniref:phthiocerol/phthiodiolone dimycocerosyl transferase family protein n=1 Tax=Pedobacter gandavensis TaxID=2679963 RepID=UPI002478A106|nr:condensation domain-containing protein [Pedobacter gandavensis]WGQ10999.1 condensation domain-containing protein [Pedobacter gandavensis]
MKRKLIMGERIMYVDESTPLNCVFAVKIRGSFSAENLHAAFAKIQKKHPLLRSSVREDQHGRPYYELSEDLEPIPVKIIKREGDDHWMEESAQEWEKLFDEPNLPMARLVWLKGEDVSELLLVCPHCICDGTTFVALMSEMLMLLDHPEKELLPYQSFNSIEELLSATFSSTRSKVVKAKFFSVIAKLFFLFKSTSNQQPAGSGYMLHWKLEAEETKRLVLACKAAGLTLHAALCVAFLDAFKAVRGGKAQGKVICPVDVRRFVKEIKQDTMFAFAPIAELSLPKEKDFWAKAKKLQEELKTKIEGMKVHELLVMSEYFHGSVRKMVKYLRATDGGHDLTLSNMGRLGIPENYDSFEVETLYSPSVGFPWRNANTLVLSTFKGRMDFTFLSNHAFLDKKEAEKIRDTALELLMAEVMVDYASY